jgi:hypothetical protein
VGIKVGDEINPTESFTIKNGTVFRIRDRDRSGRRSVPSTGHIVEEMRLLRHFSTGVLLPDFASGCLIKNNYASTCPTGIADLGRYNGLICNRVVNCPTTGVQDHADDHVVKIGPAIFIVTAFTD